MQPVTYRYSPSNRLLDVLSLGIFALFLLSVLMSAGIGLRLLGAPGTEWIMSYGVADDITFFLLFLAMAVTSGLSFAYALRLQSPKRNFLVLDDVGLTYVIIGKRRGWPWRDLEPAEVMDRPFGMKAGQLTISGSFGWMTRIGLLFMSGLASANRLAITLPDFYETPIEDIVAGINDYRDRVLGTTQPAKKAAQPSPSMQAAASGRPVNFGLSKARSKQQRLVAILIFVAVGLWMTSLSIRGYLPDDRPFSDLWSFKAAADLFLVFAILLGLVAGVWAQWAGGRTRNTLRLDPADLTYIRQGRRFVWSWQDVSDFTYHNLMTHTVFGRRRAITFTAPGKDWTWRWVRWIYGLPKAPPAVVIEDVYDTPLDDIAATLNAYRERAIGGGSAKAEP